MNLAVTIDGIDVSFNAHTFYCRRRLGKPVEFGVVLLFNYLDHETQSLLEKIAAILKKKLITFSVEWQGSAIANALELTRCVHVPAGDTHPQLQLVSLTNKYADYQPGPFTPRKRVLKGKNMLALFQTYFSELVEFDGNIGHALENIAFEDADKTNIIQYNETDHEMLALLLNWYNCRSGIKETIVLSGSAQSAKYSLSWIQPSQCESVNYPNSRKLENVFSEEYRVHLQVGNKEIPAPDLYGQNLPAQNICYLLNWGEYNQAKWDEWKMIDMPAYYKDKFVYEIQDTFQNEPGGNFTWNSKIAVLAKEDDLSVPSQSFATWSAIGTVKSRDAKEFWLQVELKDFEPGHNIADVRVTSPYSGHFGDAGLHLLPEVNTEVLIQKGADWLQPILLMHNVRSKAVLGQAPFWKLEESANWQFTSLNVSLLDMTTSASKEITMKTNGVTAKMDNSHMDIS